MGALMALTGRVDCREAASKTLLAEEDFQLGEQLEEAWEDEEEEERPIGDCSGGGWHLP